MDLLRRCLAGEAEAWERWVAEVAPLIQRAVVRTLLRHAGSASEDEAGDLTQEVFLRLVRDDCRLLRSYDPGRSALSTWLTLVARSTAIDGLRRRRLRLTSLDERAVEAPAVEAPAPAALAVPAGLLSPRQELVLKLLFEDEREVREVARLLGVDEQTVRSTKHKALTRLREHLEAGGGPGGPPRAGSRTRGSEGVEG